MKAKYQVKGIIILLWYLQQKGIVEGEGVQREGGKEIKRSIQRESVERKALGISTDGDMHACQAAADVLVCFGRNSERK